MKNKPSKEDIKNQVALIGEFVIRFERISSYIRECILKICYPNHTKNQSNNIEILLEGLTADPIRKKLQALVQDNYTSDTELLELNKKLSDKFNIVIPYRNSIVHGSMVVCRKNLNGELDSDKFLLKHPKLTKSGLDKNTMIIETDTIRKLLYKLTLIENAYLYLKIIITKKTDLERKKIFMEQLKMIIDEIGKIELNFVEKMDK